MAQSALVCPVEHQRGQMSAAGSNGLDATIPSQRGARLSLPSELLRTVEVSLWQDLYSLLGKLTVTYEMEPRIKGKVEIVLNMESKSGWGGVL